MVLAVSNTSISNIYFKRMSVSRLIMTGPNSVMTRWHFVAFGVLECFMSHFLNDQKPDFDQFNFYNHKKS